MTTLDALYPEHNAIVSASAGTGKTWFLVARIKRLLLSGAHPNSILAITFTRKATSEIKDRLETDLKKWASADDEKLKSYLVEIGLKQIIMTSNFSFGFIFCTSPIPGAPDLVLISNPP